MKNEHESGWGWGGVGQAWVGPACHTRSPVSFPTFCASFSLASGSRQSLSVLLTTPICRVKECVRRVGTEFNTSQTKVLRMTSSSLFVRATEVTKGGPTSNMPLVAGPLVSLRREVLISERHLLEVTCFHELPPD